MRMIDADALVEKFAHPPELMYTNAVVDGIRSAPTVGGWISVEDRLPGEHKLVLAVDELFYVHVNWVVEGRWMHSFCHRIIYWMTIPNLPKEGDDGIEDGGGGL